MFPDMKKIKENLKDKKALNSGKVLNHWSFVSLVTILVMLLGLVTNVFLFPIQEVQAATLYEYYNTGDDNSGNVIYEGQTFTPSITHKITSIKLKLYRTGSPGTLTAQIRTTNGEGLPTSTVLCSGTTNCDTLTTDAASEWREITLGDGYNLSADTKYAIVLLTPSAFNPPNNMLWWREDITDPTYGNGNRVYSGDDIAWNADTGVDFIFEEWGEPADTAPTVTPSAGRRVCVGPKVFDDSLVINQGATTTQTREVELSLRADGALYMSACNNNRFYNGCILEPYLGSAVTQETKSWTLTEGDGEKTVYVVFVSNCGMNSDYVSDTITLKTPVPTPVIEEVVEEEKPTEEVVEEVSVEEVVEEEVAEEVEEEVAPEKPIIEMTKEEILTKMIEILKKLIQLYTELIQILKG